MEYSTYLFHVLDLHEEEAYRRWCLIRIKESIFLVNLQENESYKHRLQQYLTNNIKAYNIAYIAKRQLFLQLNYSMSELQIKELAMGIRDLWNMEFFALGWMRAIEEEMKVFRGNLLRRAHLALGPFVENIVRLEEWERNWREMRSDVEGLVHWCIGFVDRGRRGEPCCCDKLGVDTS